MPEAPNKEREDDSSLSVAAIQEPSNALHDQAGALTTARSMRNLLFGIDR